jgi:hypothetical protein
VFSDSTADETFVGSWRAHQIVSEILSSSHAEQDRIIRVTCGDDALLRSRVLRIISSIEGATSDIASEVASPPDTFKSTESALSAQRGFSGLVMIRKVEFSATRETWLASWRDDPSSRVLLHVFTRKSDSFETVVAGFHTRANSHLEHLVAHGLTPGGRAYFVVNVVNGVPIQEYLTIFSTSACQRKELFECVRDAVDRANHAGLHHQNLTRNSILISEIDGKPFPTLVGLGLHSLSFEGGVGDLDCDRVAVKQILEDLEAEFGRTTAPVFASIMSCPIFECVSGLGEGSIGSRLLSASSNTIIRQTILGVILMIVMSLSFLFTEFGETSESVTDQFSEEFALDLEKQNGLLGSEGTRLEGDMADSHALVEQGTSRTHSANQKQGTASTRMTIERQSASPGGGELGVR